MDISVFWMTAAKKGNWWTIFFFIFDRLVYNSFTFVSLLSYVDSLIQVYLKDFNFTLY